MNIIKIYNKEADCTYITAFDISMAKYADSARINHNYTSSHIHADQHMIVNATIDKHSNLSHYICLINKKSRVYIKDYTFDTSANLSEFKECQMIECSFKVKNPIISIIQGDDKDECNIYIRSKPSF